MDEKLQARAEQLAEEFAGSATTIEDLNGLMRLMMKSGLERMLNTELDVHLGRKGDVESSAAEEAKRTGNRRNGRSKKTVQGELGEVTLATPRDRNGTFEPVILEKHQRRIPDFDEKILALYAKGMTTRDIQEIVQELYGVEVSPTLISTVTEDLDAEVTAWRTRTELTRISVEAKHTTFRFTSFTFRKPLDALPITSLVVTCSETIQLTKDQTQNCKLTATIPSDRCGWLGWGRRSGSGWPCRVRWGRCS